MISPAIIRGGLVDSEEDYDDKEEQFLWHHLSNLQRKPQNSNLNTIKY